MNATAITTMVSGPKPQTKSSTAESSTSSDDQGFANALARQASPENQNQSAADHTPVKQASTNNAATGLNDKPGKADARLSAKKLANSDETKHTLPQLALEIAFQARQQAGIKTTVTSQDIHTAQDNKHSLSAAISRGGAQPSDLSDKGGRETHSSEPINSLSGKQNHADKLAQLAARQLADAERPGLRDNVRAQAAGASKRGIALANAQFNATKADTPHNTADDGQLNSKQINSKGFLASPDTAGGMSNLEVSTGLRQAHAGSADAAQSNADALHSATPGTGIFTLPGTLAGLISPAVATPIHQAGWGADFSQQMVTLTSNAQNGTHTAELRLDPPELGPLRITLNLQDGMATAVFTSAHASVRQAIESALPQLSEQLAQAGIALGDTQVGADGQPQWASNGSADGQTAKSSASGFSLTPPPVAGTDTTSAAHRSTIISNSLVDTFA